MISADFYPTVIQFDAPSYAPTFHLTDKVMSCDPDAFSNYYWLGWLSWDNFPDCWKLSGYTLTNTELIFNIATQPQNINIGYASKYGGTGGGNNKVYPEFYHASPLVNVGSPSARYINKLDVMGVGNSGVNFGWHCSYIYGAGDSLTNRSYNDGSFTKAGKALYDFLYGDATQTIQLASGISYELDFNNMDEDGSFHFTTTYNDNNYDFVISFSYCALRNMRNVSSTATAGTQNVNAYPMYSLIMDDDIYSFMATDAAFYHPSGYPCCIVNKSTQQPTADTSAGNIIGDYIANGLNCTIPKAFITSSPSYSRLITGNAHVFNRGSDIAVYRMLTRAEMQKIVGLSLRQSDGTYNTYGYQNELSYAPYITEDNEFTATLITGDLSDDEFKAKLRPWQYDVDEWSENDYTEEDLPPYEPEGDDNPTTSGGDDHLPRRGFSIGGTGGFVTQYALSYSQLHEFANMLWAQFGDADFISNIGTTFLNDYSIKPSDILNYIVSMRVYPFNLADSVSYTDTQSANIFIGRGVFPYILTTGNTHVIADTCETFDGGYCDVPTYYNDFRDYEPASSIEVYVPFCGSVSVAPSEVVGKRLRLTYGVDYSTGALSATLWVISDTNYTLAVLSGQVAASIQMSASNEMDGILRLTSIATTIGKAMLTEDKIDASKMSDTAKHVSNATNALGMASDLVNSVGSGLPVHSIGNTNGFSNFATPPRACVTITYHKYKNPQNFAHVYGYKCNRRETLSSLNGYTKCKNVDVSGFTCHEDERSEIKALLESGVYL